MRNLHVRHADVHCFARICRVTGTSAPSGAERAVFEIDLDVALACDSVLERSRVPPARMSTARACRRAVAIDATSALMDVTQFGFTARSAADSAIGHLPFDRSRSCAG
jgi:hypothetical protein